MQKNGKKKSSPFPADAVPPALTKSASANSPGASGFRLVETSTSPRLLLPGGQQHPDSVRSLQSSTGSYRLVRLKKRPERPMGFAEEDSYMYNYYKDYYATQKRQRASRSQTGTTAAAAVNLNGSSGSSSSSASGGGGGLSLFDEQKNQGEDGDNRGGFQFEDSFQGYQPRGKMGFLEEDSFRHTHGVVTFGIGNPSLLGRLG